MGVTRALRTGDVWGVVSGALSIVTLLIGELLSVEFGLLSLASSFVGFVLFLYAIVWFGLRLLIVLSIRPDVAFELVEGAGDAVAIVRISNDWDRAVVLREVQLLYVHGANDVVRPPNTEVVNEYRVEQEYFHDGPTTEFRLGGQALELGRGMGLDDEIRCQKLGWDADISPGAFAGIELDMDPRGRGHEVIPLLWIRVFPEVRVSQLVPGIDPSFLDRIFDTIPLGVVEEAFPLGLSPVVFGMEYAKLDPDEIEVEWPPAPEA